MPSLVAVFGRRRQLNRQMAGKETLPALVSLRYAPGQAWWFYQGGPELTRPEHVALAGHGMQVARLAGRHLNLAT